MATSSLPSTSPLPLFKVFMAPSAAKDLESVLTSGMVSQGPMVEKFEQELQKRFNHPYILTVNSATSGLTIAYRLLNLQPGDEVISTPLTCLATNTPILHNNLRIKWADTDLRTCNVDLDSVKEKLSPTTKAVSIIHWGGYPVDMDKVEKLKEYAREKFGVNLQIVEDCAHSFGAKYKGKFLGFTGNISVFSFQAVKHLTCGDGGMIVLPNKEMYERAKLLRWFGIDRVKRNGGGDFRLEVDVPEWGFKFHMNDINATIGLANLPFVDANLERCRDNNRYYRSRLDNVPGVTLMDESPDYESACWIFTMRIVNKPGFLAFMKEKGVMVSQVHNRNDIHSCLADFKTELPRLDIAEKQVVCLPVGWWITDENREYIADCVHEWAESCIEIRELRSTDWEKYQEFYNRNNTFQLSLTETEFSDRLLDMDLVVVLLLNGTIIGSAKLYIEKKFVRAVGHIEDVLIDSKHRKQGYGTVLVNHLVKMGVASDCYKVVLNGQPQKAGFYQAIGFGQSGVEFSIRS